MNKDQSRAEATDRIAAHLLDNGLAETSLRQLAAAAGVSDRMLLYYFQDKTDVLGAALQQLAARLAAVLAQAIPENSRLDPGELIGEAARIVTGAQMRPYMALWIEVIAAASRREQPYVAIARNVAAGFLDWIEARLTAVRPDSRRATAAMILAMIDGLALLEACTDQRLAAQAAAQMGRITVGGRR